MMLSSLCVAAGTVVPRSATQAHGHGNNMGQLSGADDRDYFVA